MATITTANGYTSNVGQKVTEWQTTPVEMGERPCILLSDPQETNLGPPDGGNKNSAHRTFGIEFEVMLLLAEVNQTAEKARQAEADVINAIGTDQTFGGLLRRAEPGSSELKLDGDGTRISGVRMTFTAEYGRKPWSA